MLDHIASLVLLGDQRRLHHLGCMMIGRAMHARYTSLIRTLLLISSLHIVHNLPLELLLVSFRIEARLDCPSRTLRHSS